MPGKRGRPSKVWDARTNLELFRAYEIWLGLSWERAGELPERSSKWADDFLDEHKNINANGARVQLHKLLATTTHSSDKTLHVTEVLAELTRILRDGEVEEVEGEEGEEEKEENRTAPVENKEDEEAQATAMVIYQPPATSDVQPTSVYVQGASYVLTTPAPRAGYEWTLKACAVELAQQLYGRWKGPNSTIAFFLHLTAELLAQIERSRRPAIEALLERQLGTL